MTELGQTNDPRALIPGHLATVEADADALGDHGRRLADVAQRLRAVRVDGWGGQAGPRFAESWSRQPPAWFHLADALHRANTALTDYLNMLDWAQDEAAAAIELWNRGHEKSEEAESRSGYRADIERKGRFTPQAVGIDPAVDPGARLRADAQDRLDDARGQLRAAGDRVARDLLLAFSPPGLRDTLLAPLHLIDGIGHHSGAFDDGRGYVTSQYRTGPDIGGRTTPDGFEGHARLAQGSADLAYTDGDLSVRGRGEAIIGTEVSAAVVNGPDKFTANLDANVGARATTEIDARYGMFTGHTEAKAEAGAGLTGSLALTSERVKAEVDGYVGARAGIGQTVEAGGIKVGGNAEVWAGAGIKADVDVGIEDGKIHLGGHFGAAVGVGGSVGGDITIDTEEVAQTAREAADAVGRGLRELDDADSNLRSALDPFD